MAVNMSGSMEGALAEGMSDGTYKKVVRDRGGVVEANTYASRANLDDYYFGIHEAQAKVLGDGSVHVTPEYAVTPVPNSTRW